MTLSQRTLLMTGQSPVYSAPSSSSSPGANEHVRWWLEQCVELCQPQRVHWCDGSVEERRKLIDEGVKTGVFIKLNPAKLPNCYLHRSNPNDVARSEQNTFICTRTEDMAGPTNN